jgi:hypothetical protein
MQDWTEERHMRYRRKTGKDMESIYCHIGTGSNAQVWHRADVGLTGKAVTGKDMIYNVRK